jgi:uncharacterized small protein (DUF1192 family)
MLKQKITPDLTSLDNLSQRVAMIKKAKLEQDEAERQRKRLLDSESDYS